MSKINSVSRDRIHRMYVDRKVQVNQVSTVEKVDPIKPVHNQTSSINENYLIFAGSFYDKIKDLKKYYKEFYLDQQDLEDILMKFKEKKDDESLEEIIIIIQELVDKYNKTILSLKNFEGRLPNVSFSLKIHMTVLEYQVPLKTIGISILEDESLSFDPSILKDNLNFHPNCLFFIFDYQNGLIRKLFSIFRNIKVANFTDSYNYGETLPEASGMLMDQKL